MSIDQTIEQFGRDFEKAVFDAIMGKKPKERPYRKGPINGKTHCYHNCEYFGIDGGPGPVMVCNHPDAEDCYIISHAECTKGFPIKCPKGDS